MRAIVPNARDKPALGRFAAASREGKDFDKRYVAGP